MKYFKIKIGYGENDFVPIDETELETALYIFLNDLKGIFKNGVVRGKDIIGITEDWHKEMGWNVGYKLGPEDWAELQKKGILQKYTAVISLAKEKVQYLLNKGRKDLIGKNIEIKELQKLNA